MIQKLHTMDQVLLVLQIVKVLAMHYQNNLNIIMFMAQLMDQMILNII